MKKLVCLLFLFAYHISGAQITLGHNIGNTIVRTSMYSCSYGELKWARTFVVEDFGVNSGEVLTIFSGKVGVSEVSSHGITFRFNIYQIDNNFPNSFSPLNLLGRSHIQQIPYLGRSSEIIEMQFLTPIVVPANVEKILVEVEVDDLYGSTSRSVFPGGTLLDNDYSWFKTGYGCGAPTYKTTQELGFSDARFYITVAGMANFVLSTENNVDAFFNASPNPVKDVMEITSNAPIDKVEIYNLEGRLLFEEVCNGLLSKKIDYSSFYSGLYIMKVFSSKKVNSLKVIKR